MIRVVHTRSDLVNAGACFFEKDGVSCAVADVANNQYAGFLIQDDEVFQIAEGWSKGWVESAVATQAETIALERPSRPGMTF